MPAASLANYFYDVMAVGPVDNAAIIYESCRQKIGALIEERLNPDAFKDEDGRFYEKLPQYLEIGVIDRLVAEYQAYIDALDMAAIIAEAEDYILGRIDSARQENDEATISDAVAIMMKNLVRCAEQYARLQKPVDRSSVLQRYESAEVQTLGEKVFRTNSDDILLYRQELVRCVEDVCSNMMYAFVERFFSILSCSSRLNVL